MKKIYVKTEKTTNFISFNKRDSLTPFIFIHGFTGAHSCWDKVISLLKRSTLSIDLPGHGKSVFNNLKAKYTVDDWCKDFNNILKNFNIKNIDLCGYSMGGRLAIAFASKYPEKINKLFLESVSYGIQEKKDRNHRFKEDLKLTAIIENNYQEFIRIWENNPLFANQKGINSDGFFKQRKVRLSHNPEQLSKSLRSFSQGKMNFYRNQISEFKFPVSIITGQEDSKFTKIGKDMLSLNKNLFNHIVIKKTGHNIHLESLEKFINALEVK